MFIHFRPVYLVRAALKLVRLLVIVITALGLILEY